jgi:SAM-dependent methyltransferase
LTAGACRVCGRPGLEGPLVRYEDMPAAAQGMPGPDQLSSDLGAELELFACPSCGLVQIASDPVPYYRDVIRAAGVSDELRRSKQAQFEAFVAGQDLRDKRVLEVGCGRGEFLELLAPLGVEAVGLEHAEDSVAECASRGLGVIRGYPGDGALTEAGAEFDAFLLLMFLEHMPDPGSALGEIRGCLRDGAPGLVEVPNFDMIVRTAMFAELIADHLLYFSAASLRMTLELNGFVLESLAETRGGYVLTALVRKRSRPDLSRFGVRREELRRDLEAFLMRFPAGDVAVWGAGHQAFALIALTGIAGSLRYVVDSAPFKQGRYTPATHLPIVAPEMLDRDPVAAVIVMAGSYSDEVAGIAKERYPSGLVVAVMREEGLEEV